MPCDLARLQMAVTLSSRPQLVVAIFEAMKPTAGIMKHGRDEVLGCGHEHFEYLLSWPGNVLWQQLAWLLRWLS
jgi:hypothetical protein